MASSIASLPNTPSSAPLPSSSRPPPPRRHLVCCRSSSSSSPSPGLSPGTPEPRRSLLHDSLDASGIDTRHARAAREGFRSQIDCLTDLKRETSVVIRCGVDLARAALHVAEEDDSLVSHSSVPLPVDAFIGRLDDLSMDFCSRYLSTSSSAPEALLANLERFLYLDKGFRRSDGYQPDGRSLYLHSVLACRSGSSALLSLVYSEMLKMLKIWGFLNFDVDLSFPLDNLSLPRGCNKKKSKLSDQGSILTTQALLVEMLKSLKDAFWPFQYDHSSSLFLRAAEAANSMGRATFDNGDSFSSPCSSASGFEIASAKAAQHRLGRGVWTTASFGDMRRALAACERLILLDAGSAEIRDYAALLYHCGYYEDSLRYLMSYQNTRSNFPSTLLEELEDDAVKKLVVRLELILMEEGWSRSGARRKIWSSNSEPW